MDTTCGYAKQDKIWVHDPDENEWEVYALTDDLLETAPADEKQEAAETPGAGACCRA